MRSPSFREGDRRARIAKTQWELVIVNIRAFDHVGIRVGDPARALAFYQRLGFAVDDACSNDRVAEIVSGDVRLNLIFNGASPAPGHNIMIDDPVKWPGVTHPAFIVDRLQDVLDWAAAEGVTITEGPVDWGRRLTCFLRDPDGNVLEFNELVAAGENSNKTPSQAVK